MGIKALYFVIVSILMRDPVLNSPINDVKEINSLTNDHELTESASHSTPKLPPLLFPDDPKSYKIVPPNETALKILQHKKDPAAANSNFPKVVLNNQGISLFRVTNLHVDDIPEEFPTHISENLKAEIEEIQPMDLSKQEVELEERFHHLDTNSFSDDIFPQDIESHKEIRTVPNGSHIAAIIAGILIVCCLGMYIAFISWRSYLEKRYGLRELLVTQDDYYNNNDVRHLDL